jgi:hypothetical protein
MSKKRYEFDAKKHSHPFAEFVLTNFSFGISSSEILIFELDNQTIPVNQFSLAKYYFIKHDNKLKIFERFNKEEQL